MSNSAVGRWGYAIVGSRVADGLQAAGNQVIYLGLQTLAPPHKLDNGVVTIGIRYDYRGRDSLKDYLWMYKANMLITMFDIWHPETHYIPKVCENQKVAWVAHATVFTEKLSPLLLKNIGKADMIVAPSEYNKAVLDDAGLGHKTAYIPHGVDLDVFKPMGDKVKKEWRGKLGLPQDAFVAMSVMRNNSQWKNYPALFRAWKIACDESREFRERAKLLILADPHEVTGTRLDMLRKIERVESSVSFVWAKPSADLGTLDPTYEGDPEGMRHHANIGFTDDRMALLYNIADVHVSSSSGESFSLPTLESQACGVPCIASAFSTGRELIEKPGAGLLANVGAFTMNYDVLGDMALIDRTDLANKMITMQNDDKAREKMSRRALENAKRYEIGSVTQKWVRLVEEVKDRAILKADYSKGVLGI
jgi:glycosyltransferase involved in cell wall biosynthesis